MNKAELIAAITPALPAGLTLDETATNAQLETILDTLESAKKLQGAQEEIASLKDANATLTSELEAQGGNIIALNEQLAAKEAVEKSTGRTTSTVKVNDKLYIVKSGVKIDIDGQAKAFTKDEIAANKDGIADMLVEKGINVLKEV